MRFLQVVNEVKNQLSSCSLQQKAQIFKEVLQSPISIKDGVFYISDKEYNNNRFSDYLIIREHWMSMHEFDRLYIYFENLNKKDK
jgi:hypothetical protein